MRVSCLSGWTFRGWLLEALAGRKLETYRLLRQRRWVNPSRQLGVATRNGNTGSKLSGVFLLALPDNVIITLPRPRYADNLCLSLREHEFVSTYVFTSVPTSRGTSPVQEASSVLYVQSAFYTNSRGAASAIVRPMMNDRLSCCPPAQLPRHDINFVAATPNVRDIYVVRSDTYLSWALDVVARK